MRHESLEVLSCQQEEIVVVAVHLLVANALFACHEIKQLVSLLTRTLFLLLITLDRRCKLRCTSCEGSTILDFICVKCLSLLLELGDNLVFLTKLEMELPKFVLQDGAEATVSISAGLSALLRRFFCLLALFLLLRDDEVLLL